MFILDLSSQNGATLFQLSSVGRRKGHIVTSPKQRLVTGSKQATVSDTRTSGVIPSVLRILRIENCRLSPKVSHLLKQDKTVALLKAIKKKTQNITKYGNYVKVKNVFFPSRTIEGSLFAFSNFPI